MKRLKQNLPNCIEYISPFYALEDLDKYLEYFIQNISWENQSEVRAEAWMTDSLVPYTYGSGRGERTYQAVKIDSLVKEVVANYRGLTESMSLNNLNITLGCHLNFYATDKQSLGWHSDDSPLLDLDYPITIFSLGSEREIFFREKFKREKQYRIKLEHGSFLIMKPGTQENYEHKIPKQSFPCGPRVSLTYRNIKSDFYNKNYPLNDRNKRIE